METITKQNKNNSNNVIKREEKTPKEMSDVQYNCSSSTHQHSACPQVAIGISQPTPPVYTLSMTYTLGYGIPLWPV